MASALVTLAATLAVVFLGIQNQIQDYAPMGKPTAVLEDRARDILKALGSGEAADAATGYSFDAEYLLDVARKDQSQTRWDHLATNEPPVL